MPASNIAIIYGTQSNAVRRIIASDTDAELAAATDKGGVAPGESLLLFDAKTARSLSPDALLAAVAAKIGPAASQRCVETNPQGVVVKVYQADPLLDQPVTPGSTIQLHDVAVPGDSLSGGVYTSSFVPPPAITSGQKSTIDSWVSGGKSGPRPIFASATVDSEGSL